MFFVIHDVYNYDIWHYNNPNPKSKNREWIKKKIETRKKRKEK